MAATKDSSVLARIQELHKLASAARQEADSLSEGLSLATRFWAKVQRSSGCWIWTATKTRFGYGMLRVEGKNKLAHRIAYELENGAIPDDGPGHHGWVVMHSCDVASCVNPAHLRLGTNAENMREMLARGRNNPPRGVAHHNAKFTDAEVQKIRNDPRPHIRLAEEFSTSVAEIAYIRQQGWAHIPTPTVEYVDGRSLTSKGETNPNARLNPDIVRAIRASTEKPGVLAKRYGIKPDTVTKVRRRLSWAHVE